ncbi:MAG: hypothetical protein K2G18_09205 [Bacteroidales bacterium]|nr:hypothetical protein [Bacteroidales bacterium]
MKYLIRSVKYFFYFSVITAAIILILVMTGAVEGDIEQIFDGGYSALWKIAMFFALVAAVYPKVGFITRETATEQEWGQIRGQVISFFKERRYILEKETDDTLVFRYGSFSGRLLKMCEDRITVTYTEGSIITEGLRKDVMRISSGLEHRFSPDGEQVQ